MGNSSGGINWQSQSVLGSLPHTRHGHTAVMSENHMIVFGGRSISGKALNHVYRLKIAGTIGQRLRDDWIWERADGEGAYRPCGRWGHSAVMFEDRMLVFGGCCGEYLNDMYELHTGTMKWKKIQCEGHVPSPRYRHSAVNYNNTLYIFGGFNGDFLNDVYSFDTVNYQWNRENVEEHSPAIALPAGVSGHGACVYCGKMYVFGGISAYGASNHLYQLDLDKSQWRIINTSGSIPSPRQGMSLLNHGASLFVFGGITIDGKYENDFYELQLDGKLIWNKLSNDSLTRTDSSGSMSSGASSSLSPLSGSPVTSPLSPSASSSYNERSSQSYHQHHHQHQHQHQQGMGESSNSFGSLPASGDTLTPQGRSHHSHVLYCGKLVLFGGRGVTCRIEKNIFVLDLDTLDSSWIVPFSEVKYSNKDQLGSGTSAVVYKGSWRGEAVAVKKLKLKNFSSSDNEDWFKLLEEIQVMRKLKHPNIVEFKCACDKKPNLCMVSELMDRGTLKTVLQDPSIELCWEDKVSMAEDITRGMIQLHRQVPPIVHRDLKTENLLVNKDLRVKIADFGCSRYTSQVNKAQGTPFYMAPELILQTEAGPPCDVYSFAMIMWEILTRKDLFGDRYVLAIQHKVVNEGLRPDVDMEDYTDDREIKYIQLMKQCWEHDPEARPTFFQILKELKECYQDTSFNN